MDKFLIAPINEGQRTDTKAFMIPDEAYAQLNNAYTFRGRIRKRFGSKVMNNTVAPGVQQLYTRLNVALTGGAGISITTAGGAAAGNIPGVVFAVGQMFSIGNEIFTVISAVAGPQAMLATAGAGTFNITTGAYTFVGATPLTQIYFYPATPVMGFITYETGATNDNPLIAFDTQFAYQYAGGTWGRIGTAVWTGTDSQFFWGATWQGDTSYSNLLFVVNYNQPDQIKYWNGGAWTTIHPVVNAAGNTLETCRLIMTFKDRLVALNTIENDGGIRTHVNRARWAQNGSPLDQNGTPAIVAWREDIPGRGGWIDAPTREAIITAQILRDRLIVYFEGSTWELVYTSNEVLPFRWQQINTELGAESTFSQIPFDKVILGIGNVGIHACNGAQVERIDDKIPQQVFDIYAANDGIRRVCGIRDFFNEMVYWSYPSPSAFLFANYKYPNRVLVYNYKLGTWATNDDSITAFGYYEQQDGSTWAQMGEEWQWVTDPWNSGQLATHPKQIIAGNQEGFTFLIDNDNSRNAAVLSINNMTILNNVITCINHNLNVADFVLIENSQGIVNYNNRIFKVNPIDENTFRLITDDTMVGVYTGGGTVTRVSKIDIFTKQYNFYLKEARNAAISKVDFLVNNIPEAPVGQPNPQIQVECYPSYSNEPLVEEGIASGSIVCSGILDLSPYLDAAGDYVFPLEIFQEQFWHPLYFQAEGESVQLRIYYNDAQMTTPSISLSDFTLNGMAIYAMPTTSRLQ